MTLTARRWRLDRPSDLIRYRALRARRRCLVATIRSSAGYASVVNLKGAQPDRIAGGGQGGPLLFEGWH